jgi:putative nucleotidyltransferase with HDIG domain
MVYLFPRQGKFKYDFDKGKLWLYENFYSPFDVAIQKSKEEINIEVEQVIKDSRHYFIFDDQIFLEKEYNFDDELRNYLKRLAFNLGKSDDEIFIRTFPEVYAFKKRALESLKKVYDKGIIQNSKYIKDQKGNYTIIVIKDKIAQETRLDELYTKKEALQIIISSLEKIKGLNKTELNSFFDQIITPNVFYSEELTENARNKSIESISLTRGMISKGELIISKGEMVTIDRFQMLESIRDEYEKQSGARKVNQSLLILAQCIIVTLLLGLLLAFLLLFRKDIAEDNVKITFIFMLVLLFVFIISMVAKSKVLNIYLIPFCILPIVLRAFFDTRLASFAHLVTVLLMSFHVPDALEFMIIVLSGGIISIFSIVNMQKRSQLFITISVLFTIYLVIYCAYIVISDGSLSAISIAQIGWLAAGAAFTLFSYPLIYLFEKVFGFISDVSLLELSDTNNPLLKELALKAPGTFQHTLQVAILAETAVRNIGGNSLLVRTGALYHDIGKMEMARYFVENQITGVNPHDELPFAESARIIVNHVKAGIEIARKNNIPDLIIDFIRTHHGTSRVQYFYRNYLKNFPDKVIDESVFSYPGPIPYSKETAVLMMADAVEATSRTMKQYNAESIDKLVEDIINNQIEEKQFTNADITFKDITTIKKVFKRMLRNIYHVRIEYPD